MNFELIRDEAGFQSLQPFWDKLLEQSATPTPFLRWDWVSLWWEECRPKCKLAIGVIRDAAGVPEAIAPLVIGQEAEGSRRHLRQLSFLNGIGPVQGERMDFLVRRGREEYLTPRLIQIFRDIETEWDVIRLNKVPEESPNYPLLQAALAACGQHAGVLNRTECRFISLPGSWGEYEERQSGNWRRKMRRRWEMLKEGSETHLRVAGLDVPAERAFERFAELHAMHWPVGISSFLRESSLRLHRRLVARWIPQGRVLLPCIEKDGKIIAAIYGLACGKELLQYQLGWDPAYARFGLGNLGMRWSIEWAMLQGFVSYDMLPGDYDYKRLWCDQARYVADLECFHHQRPRAVLFQLLRSLKRRVSKPAISAAAP